MTDYSLSKQGRKNIQNYMSDEGYEVSFENILGDDDHIYLVLQHYENHKIVKVRFERTFFADKFIKFLKNNNLD